MEEDVINSAPAMDWLSSQFLMGSVGAPFIIGLAVGYFAKKALKVALFIAGAVIAALFAAEYYGISVINDDSLQQAASAAGGVVKQSGGYLMERLSHITSKGVSASVGFVAGLKLG